MDHTIFSRPPKEVKATERWELQTGHPIIYDWREIFARNKENDQITNKGLTLLHELAIRELEREREKTRQIELENKKFATTINFMKKKFIELKSK